jgi:pimeloyl-ACP methyl ester carboxylesterase
MWDIMPVDIRNEILHRGEWMRPSEYEAPYPITRALIEDGRKHLLLGGAIPVTCPVRILQGMKDPDVPWEHAVRLAEHLDGNPVLTLVKQGDHRLSTPDDITRLKETLEGLLSGL